MLAATLSGALLGLFYTLVAAGLYVTVVGAGVYNLAHGAAMLVAGYAAYAAVAAGVSLWVGVLAALATGLGLGLATEALLTSAGVGLGHLRAAGREQGRGVVLTLAVALLIDALALHVAGASPRKLSVSLGAVGFGVWPVRVPADQAVASAAGVVLAVGLDLLLLRTRLGRALRAAGQDRDLAQSYGLAPRRHRRAAWALSGLIAGAAGVLLVVVAYAQPYAEQAPLLAGLALVVAVAPRRPLGLVGAGMLLGAFQGGASYAVGVQWQAALFALALAALLLLRAGTRSWT
jgi:branched-chain amino acid transport system permease protein